MKKFSVIITLALCLIIGGVYAAGEWIYPGVTVNQTTAQFTPSLTIEANQGVPGTITASSTLGVNIINEGSYKAGLDYSGSVVITYKPNLGASAEFDCGIPMQIVMDIAIVPGSFSATAGGEADQSATIFAATPNENTPSATVTTVTIKTPEVDSGTVDTFTDSKLGTYAYDSVNDRYEWTITADQLSQLIQFCGGAANVYLNDRATAEDFATRAGRSLIDLSISKQP